MYIICIYHMYIYIYIHILLSISPMIRQRFIRQEYEEDERPGGANHLLRLLQSAPLGFHRYSDLKKQRVSTTGSKRYSFFPCVFYVEKRTGDILSDVGWKSAEIYLQLWFHRSCWNIVETLLKHGLTWVCVQMLNTLFCRLNQGCSRLEFVYPDVNYIVLLDPPYPPAEKCLWTVDVHLAADVRLFLQVH